MHFNLRNNTSLIAAITISLLLFSTFLFFLFKESAAQKKSILFINHSREIIYSTERLANAIKDNETFTKSFIILPNLQLQDSVKTSKAVINREMNSLLQLTKVSRNYSPTLDSLKKNVAAITQLNDSVLLFRKQVDMQYAIALLSAGTSELFLANIQQLIKQVQSNEEYLIAANKKTTVAEIQKEKNISIVIILLVLGLLIGITWKEQEKLIDTITRKSNKEIELLYRQVNQSNDAIYTVDAAFKIKSWNKGAEHLYGFSQQEATGKNPNSLLQTEITNEEINDALQKVNTEDYWQGELKRITKSGEVVYVDSSSTNIRDGNGNISGYVAVNRNITRQKKMRDEYAHLANIVEQSSEAIFSRGTDMRLISWNSGAEKLFGIPKAEAIGQNPATLGFMKLTATEISNAETTIDEYGLWMHEMNYYHRDGSTFYGAVTASKIQNEKGEATSFYFIVKDISLRKKSEDYLKQSNIELEEKVKERTVEISKNEQRFRALIENNNDIISLMDGQFKIFYRSPSAEKITGWADNDLLNKEGTQNIHPEDLAYARQIVTDLMANPGKVINTLFRNRHKDGHYLWVEGTVINLLQDKNVHAIVFNYRDVTQRKRLEDLLHKANTLARIGGWEVDLVKGSVYWTDITREIHETASDYEPALESGIDFYKDEKAKELVKLKVKEAVELGKPWDLELQIITAKNNERWIRTIGETEFVNGKCVKIYGSFQDIDQRKKAAEKLAASEKHFRSLIENNNDLIILLDENFKITYRSPSAERVTGWSNEETNNADSTLKMHPDDMRKAAGVMQEIKNNPGKPIRFTFRNLHKNGHYLWIEATAVNLLQDENVKAIVLNSRDVSERIHSEEKLAMQDLHFRTIIENISDAIVLNDEDSTILYQSPSVQKILGYSQEERQGKLVTRYIHPDDLDKYNNLYQQLKSTPNTPLHFQYRFLHKSNYYVWLEGFVSNLIAHPAVHAYVANYRDITERKQTEQRIHELNLELEEKVTKRTSQLKKSNEELEAFSYSVSHDLRAPLRAVIGYTTILEEDYSSKLDDEAKRITGVIKSNTIRMGNLIDDLLTFSRMGRNELVKTDVKSNKIIAEIIEDLDKKNCAVIEWAIEPLPVVTADRNMLKQVWVNLILNAVKYSRKNAVPKIEIGSMEKDGQIIFYVKDNGVGFDEKYKAKLFKVFQRLHSAEDFEGSGVGLAIVEKIVNKHEGKVWASAEVNKGAVFNFSIPVVKATTDMDCSI